MLVEKRSHIRRSERSRLSRFSPKACYLTEPHAEPTYLRAILTRLLMNSDNVGNVIAFILPVRSRAVPLPLLQRSLPTNSQLRLVRRADEATAQLIDSGVARLRTAGCSAAVDFLTSNGVKLRIIARVLWAPPEPPKSMTDFQRCNVFIACVQMRTTRSTSPGCTSWVSDHV